MDLNNYKITLTLNSTTLVDILTAINLNKSNSERLKAEAEKLGLPATVWEDMIVSMNNARAELSAAHLAGEIVR